MKKNFILALITFLLVGIAETSHAQHFYVKVVPPPPVYVHPVAPSPHHVWVAHEYEWRGGAYVVKPGYWAMPPHHGGVWVPGHWREEREHGSYWVPGHWR